MNAVTPVYIALGTNLGDREQNLQTAKALLSRKADILQESSVYSTPPWGYLDQPDFLNQVIEISTRLKPIPLLRFLKGIEKHMGRVKRIVNGPRQIDLDILFYGDAVIETDDLQIPHPRMAGRAFVLVPLAEIAPALIHPLLNLSVQEMLSEADASGVTRL